MAATLSVDPGGVLQSCSGRRHPRVRPWRAEGALLPLALPAAPLKARPVARPPLEDARVPHAREGARARLVIRASDLRDGAKLLGEKPKVTRLARLQEEHDNDPYGPENLYGGSGCLRLQGALALHAGPGGALLATELGPDPRLVLPRAPLGPPTPGPACRPLAGTPVYALDAREETGGGLLLLARHRYGAALSCLAEGEAGPELAAVLGLPCSRGAAAACLLPGARAATLDTAAGLVLWDLVAGQATARLRLPHLLDGDLLRWGWASLGRSLHPRHLLLADRGGLGILDPRDGGVRSLGLGLQHCELVRGAVEGRAPHQAWAATDAHLLLLDLRQPRAPALRLAHTLAGAGRAPVAGLARGAAGGRAEDWLVVYSRWGDLGLAVTDWGHSACAAWQPVEPGCLGLACSPAGPAPSVLGRVRELRGWRATVQRARELGGDWLDAPVEERCGVPFTGMAVAEEADGSVVVYASNALGDLFGKQLVRGEVAAEDVAVEEEVVARREEAWLEEWGEGVASGALLPRPRLMADTRLTNRRVGRFGSCMVKPGEDLEWALPCTARTAAWAAREPGRERGGSLLPCPPSVELPRPAKGGKRNLDQARAEAARQTLNVAYLEQFSTLGDRERTDVPGVDDKRTWWTVKTHKEAERIRRRDPLCLGGPAPGEAGTSRARQGGAVWRRLQGEQAAEPGDHGGLLPGFPALDLAKFLPGRGANRHSEAMLGILLGEKAEPVKGGQVGPAEPGEVPRPPREEDTSFPLDTFWDDLGVGAPHGPGPGRGEGEDEEGLYEL
jgi:hypothetical protein